MILSTEIIHNLYLVTCHCEQHTKKKRKTTVAKKKYQNNRQETKYDIGSDKLLGTYFVTLNEQF